jgi:hypothetical protein
LTPSERSPIRFQLYRVKLIRPHQQLITSDQLSASDLLAEAIRSRPELESGLGTTWHVGNVVEIPDHQALYFAIGRTTGNTVERFDEEAKNFVEEPQETSPYTRCIVLWDLGVAAIAHKSRLAPKTQGVARRLRGLLERTDSILRNGIQVDVSPVPDPQSFIATIEAAYAVLGFTATFRGPNPIDADELFQNPLAKIASATGAEAGEVKLKSSDLDRDALTSIARSTAATGNHASAKVQDSKGALSRTVKMVQSPVEISYREDDVAPATIAADLRARYQEVRGNEGNQDRQDGRPDLTVQ